MEEKEGLLLSDNEGKADHASKKRDFFRHERDSGITSRRRVVVTVSIILICTFIIVISILIARWKFLFHRVPHHLKVSTDCGHVRGKLDHHELVYSFKGIPYARPPTGQHRWKPPVSLKSARKCWSGTLKADTFGSPCPQLWGGKFVGSEDCLYLNVLAPANKKGKGKLEKRLLPVVVWIHGGDLTTFSGAESGPGSLPGYAPNTRFTHDIDAVVVSINYRLNAFGFMALDVLSQSSPTKTSGNYGFMDQILALKWVQNNIEGFGGDKSKVTVIGHSSGATSIFALLASDAAQGLFRTVIPMSGSPVFNKTTAQASKDNFIFIENSKCNKSSRSQTLSCLYSLSTEQVIRAVPWKTFPFWAMEDLTWIPKPGSFNGALAVIDGDVVKFPPGELALHQKGRSHKVTVVMGNTAQETGFSPRYHFGANDYSKYVNVTRTALNKFMSKTDSKKAIQLYSGFHPTAGSRPQYLYETLVSDLRAICGTIVLAQNFSTSPLHTVYYYVISQGPTQSVRLLGKSLNFAFHSWDTLALFGFNVGHSFDAQPPDIALLHALRRQIKHVVRFGHPATSDWRRVPLATAVFENSTLSFIGPKGYHDKQCSFWLNHGFFAYSWIN